MTSDEPLPDRCGAECRDGGYCTQYPVEGSDRCRMHGAHGGGPKGEDNGNYKHGMYSDYLGDEDLDRAENWMDLAEGDLSLDEMEQMLEELILFNQVRYERGAGLVPDPELVEEYQCPNCGCSMPEEGRECRNPQCGYLGEPELANEYVSLNDKAVAARTGKIANLIRIYKNVKEGSDVNLNHSGGISKELDLDEESKEALRNVFAKRREEE